MPAGPYDHAGRSAQRIAARACELAPTLTEPKSVALRDGGQINAIGTLRVS